MAENDVSEKIQKLRKLNEQREKEENDNVNENH